MKTRLIISLVLIGVLAFGAGLGTVAYFTSQATSEDNIFETGTLIIGVPSEGENSGIFDIENWQPGDSATETLTVNNLGSLPMKYKVTAVFGDELEASVAEAAALEDILDLEIKKDGTVIYNGKLSGLASGLDVDTDFAAGASQVLSFEVSMPTSAGNEYQGADVTVQFVFDATQINNSGWDE